MGDQLDVVDVYGTIEGVAGADYLQGCGAAAAARTTSPSGGRG